MWELISEGSQLTDSKPKVVSLINHGLLPRQHLVQVSLVDRQELVQKRACGTTQCHVCAGFLLVGAPLRITPSLSARGIGNVSSKPPAGRRYGMTSPLNDVLGWDEKLCVPADAQVLIGGKHEPCNEFASTVPLLVGQGSGAILIEQYLSRYRCQLGIDGERQDIFFTSVESSTLLGFAFLNALGKHRVCVFEIEPSFCTVIDNP